MSTFRPLPTAGQPWFSQTGLPLQFEYFFALDNYVRMLQTTGVPSARKIIAGAGLTGGGDLSADRTLSVQFGTAAGTVAQGNDSRITGAAQTTDLGSAAFSDTTDFDIPRTPSALTRTNDTNVTLTLSGTPSSALLQATSLTLGWAGTLSVARGGTGGGTASGTLLDNITGFSSTGQLVRTAAGTYAFRTLTAPAAGLTVSNGNGVSGNPTLTLANDLAALEGLTGTNTIYYRSGTDTWSPITISSPLSFSSGILSLGGGQLPATATNDDAGAGKVGEFISSSVVSGSAVTLTTNAAKTITSITLSAGDWDLAGIASFLPANTTSVTAFVGCFSLTTDTLDTTPGRVVAPPMAATTYNGSTGVHVAMPTCRFSLATSTTIYLVAYSTFTVAANKAYGLIRARRVR